MQRHEDRLHQRLNMMKRVRTSLVALQQDAWHEAEQLFMDLTSLRDEDDAITWIINERREFAARLALREDLFRVQRQISIVHQSQSIGIDLPDRFIEEIHAKWGKVDGQKLSLLMDDIQRASPEILNGVVRVLRQGSTCTMSTYISSQQKRLVDILVELPEETDSLLWVSENHSHIAASAALEWIIQHYSPPMSMDVGAIQTIVEPVSQVHNDYFSVSAHRVIIGEIGIALEAEVKFNIDILRHYMKHKDSLVRWNGFTCIQDNYGYCYMIKYNEMRTASDGRQYSADIQMALFPSLSSDTRKLILVSSPSILTISGDLSSGLTISDERIVTEDITWEIMFS